MNQFLPIPAIIIGVVLYFFFWCGLLIVIGRASGWIALAQRYRATEEFTGKRWHMQHAQFRWSMNYSGALTVGANASGLHLSILFPFRPGHPTLFIPWADAKIDMKQSFWLGKFMEIQFPELPGIYVRFGEKLARKIAETVGPQLVK